MTAIETWARENNIVLRLNSDSTEVLRLSYCPCGHITDNTTLCIVKAERGITAALKLAKLVLDGMQRDSKIHSAMEKWQ